MTINIATTKDQSARLLRCGVSADSADMTLRTETGEVNFSHYSLETELKFYGYDDPKRHIEIIPAWSLSALLGLLPKHLDSFPMTKWYPPFIDEYDEIEAVEMYTPSVLDGDVKLCFGGKTWDVDYDWDGFMGYLPQSENPIEAIVLAIELLHANGYKFNEIKQSE